MSWFRSIRMTVSSVTVVSVLVYDGTVSSETGCDDMLVSLSVMYRYE